MPPVQTEPHPELQTNVKAAMAEFMNGFSAFRADVEKRFARQEQRMKQTEQKSHNPTRPHLSAAMTPEVPHQKAFNAYLRFGDDDGLRGLELEGKALSTAVNSDGGYLVDPVTSDSVQSVLSGAASIRQIANVVTVEATSYDVLVDHGELGHGWANEVDATSETTTPTIDRIAIPLHELSALPKASQRLLDDAAFDIEGWLAGRIGEKFARAEAAAFVSGDGIDKPTGFLTHATAHNDSWTWGGLGYVNSGSESGFSGPEVLIDLVYALGAEYRAGASFVMNSQTAGMVRKLKDADGRFLWSDGLAAGEPARLLGYPVVIAEDMPDIAANSYAIAFGNFGVGYTVAERPDLRILRDPFSAKPHVLFYATKRVGGDVSDFAAIKLLRFSNS
ncbi:phage major capsid protein [Thalassobius sp. Cn5-15]|nr:phage major capsid protein [Thalassobius sp. Cn5-15]MCG7492069.1 phage major capsid protein [Thalassobius sp. Cn5-15]